MEKNNKYLKLDKLYLEYANEFAGEELVFGDGNYNSGIVMIGEAPGKDEVIQGKPFVGLAGGKLKEFMDYIGLTREDLYVTNAIKYRLFKTNSKTNKKSNRPAKVNEIKSSIACLMQELKVLDPVLVITLGNVPLKAVTSDFKMTIGDVHGKEIISEGIRIFPLYHPASLIYNRSLEETYYKDLDKLKIILRS
ncbi:MAG: uracil-DNA glycosylase [Clostridiales bacterium]|nr:uracil-DNA glycosylase [Clostridiales bacterium]